jgi:hypothetical protein
MKNTQKVKNGHRYDLHGWTYVSVHGSPKDRGLAYGQLLASDMKEVRRILDFVVYNDFGVKWDFFIDAAKKYYSPKIQQHFPEFYQEMKGFAEGATMDIHEVVAWNNYFTLTESWWANMPAAESARVKGSSAHFTKVSSTEGGGIGGIGGRGGGGGAQERCSAFMAVGTDWTTDGKIVCAHNNFSNFVDGQLAKYVLDIKPDKGNRILMMGFPGWIWSGTDFFVTSAGIIGTETTIGGFISYENNIPISCRIRKAMQYGNTLDAYETILLNGNSGDYANSWLLGNTHTNEIMRIELGLRFHNTERTNNGYFIGFNAPYDPRIRNLECVNTGIDDIRRHQGARKVRLEDLMDQWKGKLNLAIAQQIISDHYDVYLDKENPCSRTCCAHYELDGREYMSDPSRPKPYQPRGALDGNAVDTALAKQMSFSVRWGSSCGMPFDASKFCAKNRVWAYLLPYLHDRPTQPWTIFSAANNTDTKERKETKAKSQKTTKRAHRKKRVKIPRGLKSKTQTKSKSKS